MSVPALPSQVHAWIEPPDVSGLVTEDDAPMDNFPSEKQQRLLTESLYSSWVGPAPGEDGQPRTFLAASNIGIFAGLKEQAIVPDVLLSLDVELSQDWWEKKNRSYFAWEMGKLPEVVIEIVSNREGDELGSKRRRYARMKIDHYVVWDPAQVLGETQLRAFERRGDLYMPMDRLWFESVGLGLVVWDGVFEGRRDRWLRWCLEDGSLVPTGAERAGNEKARADDEKARAENEKARAENEKARADDEKARADDEKARADDEKARADRLAARLRALGVDPDE